MSEEVYLATFKALSDPVRVRIFDMLKSGKRCACKILEEFAITQPTLSYHMKLLTDCQLVIAEKCGKWTHYSINWETTKAVTKFFLEI
ncbi:MAG: metalloregulator ArsR/SmtB family transcription factor [Clostridia bacterium]|nr:metalloregulator ArsR/SmtB family transcription factor [Clostridia bacterium]